MTPSLIAEPQVFGGARLLCADARSSEPYARVLAGRRAHLLLTDPPYCLLTRRRKGGDARDPKGRKIDREPITRFETVRDYRRFTEQWLPAAVSHLTGDAPLVIWTNFLGQEPITSTAKALGYAHLWGEFVWAKRTTEKSGNERLLRVYETALVLARAPRAPSKPADPSLPWAVVAGYDDDGEAALCGNHPNHKPFSVLEPLLRTFVPPSGLVLDPFGGSGSVAAAALRLGRQAAVLELDEAWSKTIAKRLSSVA